MCGIGTWWDPLARQKVGINRRNHLKAMREVVTVVRQLLARQRVTYHGEFVHLDDVELEMSFMDTQGAAPCAYLHQRDRPANDGVWQGKSPMV